MLIFNAEHDLCLANGDPNFVAPASAAKFSKDCCNILEYIVESPAPEEIKVWGWNPAIKNKLIKQGISQNKLPNDEQIQTIRALSHREIAVKAWNYIASRINPKFKEYLTPDSPIKIINPDQVSYILTQRKQIVLKAPWSGSGKGLRWATEQATSIPELLRWCAKIIKSQGSVICETQDSVLQDFAMLFHVGKTSESNQDVVSFVGYSLFNCTNGAYKSNILASDEYIQRTICNYIPSTLLEEVKSLLIEFLQTHFCGKYRGYLGVDMYITSTSRLQPCVEINVRMTMGLLANKIFKKYCNNEEDGKYEMRVLYNSNNQIIRNLLLTANKTLTPLSNDSNYAIAIFKRD